MAIFSDAVEKARAELSEILYEQGLEKARVQRWQEGLHVVRGRPSSTSEESASAMPRAPKLELAGGVSAT